MCTYLYLTYLPHLLYSGIRKAQEQDHGIDVALDNYLIEQSRPALDEGVSVSINSAVTNLNRYIL
jgi:hypothetical protein